MENYVKVLPYKENYVGTLCFTFYFLSFNIIVVCYRYDLSITFLKQNCEFDLSIVFEMLL